MNSYCCKLFTLFGIVAIAVVGVPQPASAEICDLSVVSSCEINDGIKVGIFSTDYIHPTGTGVIDPFLRLQQKGSEQGYNTSARSYPIPPPGPKTQFDEKTDPNYTRNLPTVELGTQVIDGITYVEFFLDINEPAGTKDGQYMITLDQLEIYVSNTPNLDKYSNTNSNNGSGSLGSLTSGATATKIYDMDTSGDNWVNLSYLVSGQGSGSSDMSFLLDASLFEGYEYVYLYSQFGDDTPADMVQKNKKQTVYVDDLKYKSEAGFEEWFSQAGQQNTVPEPSTSALLIATGLAFGIRRLRRS